MKVLSVLLINPPSIIELSSNVPSYVSENSGNLPPLGLLYIATYLKNNSHHKVKILDALLENKSFGEIAQESLKHDIVGITTTTFTLINVIKQIQIIRKINNKSTIVLGGPHVSIYPEESCHIPGVDYCLSGEADITFTELVNNIAIKCEKKNIYGLYWKANDKVYRNMRDVRTIDVNSIPFPDRKLIAYDRYTSILSKKQKSSGFVTTAFSSRGCPYKCIFCDRPHLGKKFRAISSAKVLDEINSCVDLNIREIFFYDDTFTVNKDRVMEICDQLISQQIDIKWDIRARVDTVNEKMLRIMKKAGCTRIHFGVEAGSSEMMKVLKKGITRKQALYAFHSAKKSGIETLGYFMIGCPEETRSQMHETFNFALQLKPDFAHFAILTPFPGTPLYNECLKAGLYDHDYWQNFALNPSTNFIPKYLPNTLPEVDLIQLLDGFYKKFYFRPEYLIKQTLKVRSIKDFANKISVAKSIFFSTGSNDKCNV